MANTKYYAWSLIRIGGEEISPGTVVTPDRIGDDWNALIVGKAVRERPYPKMPESFQGSVRAWRMEQLRKLREDTGDELDYLEEEE